MHVLCYSSLGITPSGVLPSYHKSALYVNGMDADVELKLLDGIQGLHCDQFLWHQMCCMAHHSTFHSKAHMEAEIKRN